MVLSSFATSVDDYAYASFRVRVSVIVYTVIVYTAAVYITMIKVYFKIRNLISYSN